MQSSLVRRPHFFNVILPPSIHDGKLEIPVEFVRKFGVDLPDVAVLEVPDGREWSIELKKIDGAVWFHNGWQGFLKHYNISAGHFIVFGYDGSSHFFARIFNESACEINYSHNVDTPRESNLLNNGKMLESEKRGSGDSFILGKRPASTYDIGSTSKPRGLSRKEGEKNKDQKEMEELPYQCELNQVKKDKSKEGEDTFHAKQDEHMCTPLAENTRRPITTEERENAKHLAQMLKTEKPSFMVVMKPSYLKKGLNVPLSFAREHFVGGAHNVTLQVPNGRTWSVQLCFNCKIKALLSGGWKTFVQENMLEDGDCCVFELLKVEEIELKVSIFRVVEKEIQPESAVVARRKQTKPRKRTENKATRETRDFKSVHPFFEAYVHPSYALGGYMTLKNSFVKRHLANNLESVILQDLDGRKWPISCKMINGQGRLGAGWGNFMKEKNIEEGDVCVFELIEKEGTVLKVSIFKSH